MRGVAPDLDFTFGVGAGLDKQSDDLNVSRRAGDVKRRRVVDAFYLEIAVFSYPKQSMRDLGITFGARGPAPSAGVLPSASLTFGSAPAWSSTRAESKCPFIDAGANGISKCGEPRSFPALLEWPSRRHRWCESSFSPTPTS
jgi:hypothetical protein